MVFCGAGFLYGKMDSVTFMNVSKQIVDLLRGGLELMFSSKCPMKFIITEKGEKFQSYTSFLTSEDIIRLKKNAQFSDK